ncbi:MAG: hypothetical protein EA379_11075 [Phycisphaerales bacterium]|nr:MAG: hypothetical protein EA379_11075 [Phycisphaerales bacterium]
MNRSIKTSRIVLAAGFLLSVGALDAAAVDRFWTNTNGGEFGNAGNWAGAAPDVSDTAIFGVPGTFTVTFPVTAQTAGLLMRDGDVTFQFGVNPGYVVTGLAVIGEEVGATSVLRVTTRRFSLSTLRLGFVANTSGELVIDGADAELDVSGSTTVGLSGDGVIRVAGGGKATFFSDVTVGFNGGANGEVIVTGGGSNAVFEAGLSIGFIGDGAVRVMGGGLATSNSASFGAGFTGFGELEVRGSGSAFNNTVSTFIGADGAGALTIAAGGAVNSFGASLGAFAGSEGEGDVAGAGSRWSIGQVLQIGRQGTGSLVVRNGGLVENTQNLFVGSLTGSEGFLEVRGSSSAMQVGQQIIVGREGVGSMLIANGANVTSSGVGSASFSGGIVGGFASGVGSATVRGAGSTWTISPGSMNVGFLGDGAMFIEQGGSVVSGDAYIGRQSGSMGHVEITDSGSAWTAGGTLRIALDPNNAIGGSGTLRLLNGGVMNPTAAIIGQQGMLTGEGGVLQSDVENRGVVEPGAPTGVLNIAGAYTQSQSGALRIVFDDTAGGGGPIHGSLSVSGAASLNGTLEVVLAPDANPPAGAYTVLTATGVSGSFASVIPVTLPDGRTFDVDIFSDSVVVTLGDPSPTNCPGDTNGDNVVDFADLSTVLGEFGLTGAGLDGDVNGDEVVDFADLSIVLSNFGNEC